MIVLETALPAKFAATIREALGPRAARPAALAGHRGLPQALRGDAGRRAGVKRYHRRQCLTAMNAAIDRRGQPPC